MIAYRTSSMQKLFLRMSQVMHPAIVISFHLGHGSLRQLVFLAKEMEKQPHTYHLRNFLVVFG